MYNHAIQDTFLEQETTIKHKYEVYNSWNLKKERQ